MHKWSNFTAQDWSNGCGVRAVDPRSVSAACSTTASPWCKLTIPGTPFAINYSINTAPTAPCKYIFFRLYMNGRPIAAWGIDSEVLTAGKVARSLWAPCALHNDQIGFEGRNFVFLSGQERKSVAEDGGLIEIQAFRARERRARAPRLEEFRFQENYGIA